ncbi:hypothetical protein [Cellulomonas endophytica]|uniref:hypothetical protein n=1 Tax=Cellulomonas endophytica TaxID=2494735 RepID=UPI0010110262|nr:hypothetical protein [Cellulomonas endophytica]
MDPEVQQLAGQLAASALRNTAAMVADQVRTITSSKRDRDAVAELEQIISELLADKAEITRIAQAYQEQLVAQKITDDEVRYVADTVVPTLKEVAKTTGTSESEIDKVLPALEALISVQTVTVLQLFGFNFKRAVGEPLTDLVARAIQNAGPAPVDVAADLTLARARQQAAMAEAVLDPDAFARLQAVFGGA